MKIKKVWAAFLTASLFTSLAAGCGNSSEPESLDTAGKSSETAVGSSGDSGDSTQGYDEDIAEIEVMFWTMNTIPRDVQMVEDAINEITEEKINTQVHLNILEMGNYAQQLNLILSSNEKMDLMVTLPGESAHFNSMSSQNQLTDLTELLPEYAPELLETVPESWLKGTMVDGKILSVTSYGDKATPLGFVCRTDILEQTGIDPETLKTADDFEALFEKVKAVDPDITPLAVGNKKILTTPYLIDSEGNFVKYDSLGDSDNALIGIMEGDETTIQNNYLRPEFVETAKCFTSWYEKGYVYKDGANFDEAAETLISANTAFGYFSTVPVGSEASKSAVCGHDMTIIYLDNEPLISTELIRKFTWAVPTTATEPEAAVKFMNLLFTDSEVLNLLTWSIEGVHYQTLEDGTIDFMDGEDANSCGYYIGDETAILGSGFLAKVRTGSEPDLRAESETMNLNATVSDFLGFSFDSEGFENQIAGITNAIAECRPSLASGLYTENYYNDFIQKLNDSGAQEYIANIQQQLDAWLSENRSGE